MIYQGANGDFSVAPIDILIALGHKVLDSKKSEPFS